MNTIKFAVSGIPKPQPRPRAFARNMGGGKFAARVYDAGTAEGWKAAVAIAAKPLLPTEPTMEALAVKIDFLMPRPKGHFTSKGALTKSAPLQPCNKDDLDNLAKAVLDALTQIGMWRDDGQIVQLSLSKQYATSGSGCRVEVNTFG